MKKSVLFLLLILALVNVHAQKDSIQAPYLRFPTFPPVTLLLPDNSPFKKDDLEKKAAVMLMLFSPSCDHCQHETEELLKHIDKFNRIQVIMSTTMPFDSMLAFRKRYQLDQYKQIIVGYDQHYFLPVFFNIRTLPFLAFYNRNKELISVFEGAMPIEKALAELQKQK